MFNNRKIKELERQLSYLKESIERINEEKTRADNTIERLGFLLERPIDYKVGDVPFTNIVITKITPVHKTINYSYNGYPFKSWEWEIKAFDSKNKREIYLKLDCGNNLINPNK